MLEEDSGEPKEPFFKEHWQCPICPYEAHSVTKFGLLGLKQHHMAKHDKIKDDSILMHTTVAPAIRRNYNTLKINRIDAAFLKTRGIKIDEDIEIDWEDFGDGKLEKKQKSFS